MTRHSIYLDNYRGFSDAFIHIKPVNFLVGENSTGKSSFLDLLATFYSPGFWVFEPSLARSPLENKHFLDLVSVDSNNRSSFTVGLVTEDNDPGRCEATLITYGNLEGRPYLSRYTRVTDSHVFSVFRAKQTKGHAKHIDYRSHPLPSSPVSRESFARASIEAHRSKAGYKKTPLPEGTEGMPLLLQLESLRNPKSEVGKIIAHIPAPFGPELVTLAPIRTKPLRTYDQPQTAFSPEGGHTPYVIKKQLATKTAAEEFKKRLTQIGRESGLFKDLTIKQYGRGPQAPFELDIVLANKGLSIDNVGYGVSQALPVFVEMLVRQPLTSFAIQQPEVHLHPRAQATVGDLLAELARLEGKKFFVETHSDFTIDRFRINLKKSIDTKVDSQILFFERTATGNKATSIEIAHDGSISDAQPDNYRLFFLNEQLDLLT